MKIYFVSATGAAAFMAEMLEVIARAVEDVGGTTCLHEGPFPETDSDDVFVVVPHEYFVFTPATRHPTSEQLSRTIGFCVEHPGASKFDEFGVSVKWASLLAGRVDINRDSLEAMRNLGLPAEPYCLGYTPLWDAWKGDRNAPRPIDVTYMGTTEPRRNQVLAQNADQLWPWNNQLLIPPHESMVRPRAEFLMGSDKHRHLAQCKILLNLHRGQSRSLEWVRVLEAMCNGCVVISEPSIDSAPLVPDEHIIFGRSEELGKLANDLLLDPERLARIRDNAYAFVRSEMSMRTSASVLLEMAQRISKSIPVPSTRVAAGPGGPRRLNPDRASTVTTRTSEIRVSQEPSIDVVLTRLPGDPDLSAALRGLEAQTYKNFRVLVCDARGSGADGDEVLSLASERMEIYVFIPDSLGHPRAFYRDRILEQSSGEYVFVMDRSHVCFPNVLERLAAAVTKQPDAAASYAMVADAHGGLGNHHMMEGHRIAQTAYLGAPFLISRQDLEGMGWFMNAQGPNDEQFQKFWLNFARQGLGAVFVQQILVQVDRDKPESVRGRNGRNRRRVFRPREFAGQRPN